MKNRFGFIPIVLPAIVMVLIIGLINLAGPQSGVQADHGDLITGDSPTLKSLTLSYSDGGGVSRNIPLTRKGASGGFNPVRTHYTASIDIAVGNTAVDIAAVATGATNTIFIDVDVPGEGTDRTDTSGDGADGNQTLADYDIGAAAGTTKYTITVSKDGEAAGKGTPADNSVYVVELTRKAAEVGATSPKLETLSLTMRNAADANSGGARPLFRTTDGGQIAFNSGIKNYKATIPYDAKAFEIAATANSQSGATGVEILGKAVASATTTIPAGTSKTYTITAVGPGATTDYKLTVKRNMPQAATIVVTRDTTRSVTEDAGEGTVTPAPDVNKYTQDVSVNYNVYRVEVSATQLVTENLNNTDTSYSSDGLHVSYDPAGAFDSTDVAGDPAGVLLIPGQTKAIKIKVSHKLLGVTNPATTTYTLNVSRKAPALSTNNMSDTITGTGEGVSPLTLRLPGKTTNALPKRDADNNIDGTQPVTTTPYKVTVPYDVGTVTLWWTKGAEPIQTSTEVGNFQEMKVSASPDDADKTALYHQVNLKDPGKKTSITVTAKAYNGSKKTDYKIEVTRDKPKFAPFTTGYSSPDNLDPTPGVDSKIEIAGVQVFASDATSTPSSFTNEGNELMVYWRKDSSHKWMEGFDPDTTTGYLATTTYENDHAWVMLGAVATPNTTGKEARTVFFSADHPRSKGGTTVPVTNKGYYLPLEVGNNDFEVDVGIGVPNGTTTYKFTLRRYQPEPVLQFSLYDKNGDLMSASTSTVTFNLDASIKTYTLTEDDGFTVDVDAVRMNAYVENADVRAKQDVRVSVGDVTVPITDTKIDSGDEITTAAGYVHKYLSAGPNSLTFEVDYREKHDAKTLAGESTHVLTIQREGNEVPRFRPNNLEGKLHHLVYNEAIDTSTQLIPLPYGLSGNLGLKYALVGTPALPDDMNDSYVLPDDTKKMDGYLAGTPKIQPDGLFADHEITFTVSDNDKITKDDSATLKFKLRIWNSRDAYNQYGPGAPPARDWGELIHLGVYHEGDKGSSCNARLMRRPGDTSALDVCANLTPTFDPNTRTYTVEVPTDIDTVDIHSVASSTARLALRGEGGTDLGAGSTVYDNYTVGSETGDRHEWNGYELENGSGGSPARNVYLMSVTDGPNGPDGSGAVTVVYRLTITREADNRVVFSDADKAGQPKVVQVYAGIPLSGNAGDVDKIKFPLAMGGNGETSTWTYTLKHNPSDGGNFSDNDFEGMTFKALQPGEDPGKNPPNLSGTPVLDTPAGQDSYRSVSETTYRVRDNDNNTAATDGDKISYTIIVHKDVSLDSYTVGEGIGSTVSRAELGKASRTIPSTWSQGGPNDDYSDWIYSHETLTSYTFAVPYNATSITFAADARSDSATVKIKPDDADGDASNGHQVSLGSGNNVVTVTVSDGRVTAKHMINLSRPGLQAESLTVDTDRGTPVGASAGVTLVRPDGKKGFLRNVYKYTAEVETWVETLRIAAVPADDGAVAFVERNAIPTATGYSVVLLPEAGESKTYTVYLRIPGQNDATGRYTIEVTRKADTAPTFASSVANETYQSGVEMETLRLPKATGGNGNNLTYTINESALIDMGMTFDANARQISGTPTLERGQKSATIYLTYRAIDEDGNKDDSDNAVLKFSITVQRDPVTEPAPGDDGFPDDESEITLNTLEVTFRRPGDNNSVYRPAALSPEFNPQTTDYSVEVPHDYTYAWVEARPSDSGAGVYIDSVLQQTVSRAPIDGTTAQIVVEHQQHPDLGRMTYNLTLKLTEESKPNFAGMEIGSEIYIADGTAITPKQLPEAADGNAPITYKLMYDEKNEVGVTGVGGLYFDADNRLLTGVPTLGSGGGTVEYEFTLVGTDDDGDVTDPGLTFTVTVCESADLPGCDSTDNPGSTPVDIAVSRSGSGATMTWKPGDDAASQLVVAFVASDPANTLKADSVSGNARRYTFSGLDAASTYVFAVIGIDANGGYGTPGNYFVAQTTQ